MSDNGRRQRHILIGRGSRALCGVLIRFWERVFEGLEQAEAALEDDTGDEPCEDCLELARSIA